MRPYLDPAMQMQLAELEYAAIEASAAWEAFALYRDMNLSVMLSGNKLVAPPEDKFSAEHYAHEERFRLALMKYRALATPAAITALFKRLREVRPCDS